MMGPSRVVRIGLVLTLVLLPAIGSWGGDVPAFGADAAVPAPTMGPATVDGPGAVAVEFTPPDPAADSYRVYLSSAADGTYAPVADGAGSCAGVVAASPCTVTGLAPGGAYYFKALSVTGTDLGPLAAIASSATAITTPALVPAPMVALSGDRELSLSWDGSTGTAAAPVDSYEVRWSTDALHYQVFSTGECASPTEHLCTATGLAGDASYWFEVAAVNGAGTGAFSDASEPVAAVAGPDAPVIHPPTVTGPGLISVSWTPSGGVVDSYHVYVSTIVDGEYVLLDTGDCNETTAYACTMRGAAGTEYFFEVCGVHSGIEGARSDASVGVTAVNAPALPGVPSAVAWDEGTMRVSWTPPRSTTAAPVAFYRLQMSTDDGRGYVDVRRPGCHFPIASSCYINGLTVGGSYRFRVAAGNAAGQSVFSHASYPVTATGLWRYR